MKMKSIVKTTRRLILPLAILILLGPSIGGAEAAAGARKIKFSIGASSPGGGFYMGASAISTVVNTKLSGYECNVEVTGASANNAALVQAGEIQMGMCATEVAWEAYNGRYYFEGKRQCGDIRAVMPGWSGVYMFITTADSGVRSIADFSGKPYSSGPKGSSNEVVTNRVFNMLGITPKMMNLPNSDASRSLGDGTIAGFSLAHPAAVVSELEATNSVRIITIPEKDRQAFKDAFPQYIWLDVPAGYYKALPKGAHNVGLYNMVISSKKQSEDLVYSVVKACYENRELVKTVFPQFSDEMGLENIGYSTIPYHIGAIKYFREKGVDIPASLIPPEAL